MYKMFFLDYIYKDLKPIEMKIAQKIYIEHKDYKEIKIDLWVSKSAFYRYSKKIKDKIKNIDYEKVGKIGTL